MEYREVAAMLHDAEMVLVGVGEDFEGKEDLMREEAYPETCRDIADAGMEWVMPYVNRFFLEKNEKLKTAWRTLGRLLEKKNYFVVSVCMNGMAPEAGLLPDRLAEPCGSYERQQCGAGCAGSTVPAEDALLREVERCIRGEKSWKELEAPLCARCKAPVVFNSLYAEHYDEEGYRVNWERYTKWLQGTVGKKLCILELGAGLMFAGVLRFRFEKIAALNQKAAFIRIHESLYQMPNEISGRGKSISQNALDFMAEMAELC